MLFFYSFVLIIFGILLTFFAILLFFFKWQYSYWSRQKIQFVTPSIPFGNMSNPSVLHMGESFQILYKILKEKKWKYAGIYSFASPNLLVADTEILKKILVADFNVFSGRGVYYNEELEPVSANLFSMSGPQWSNLRAKISTTLTSNKIKIMFQTLLNCKKNLEEEIIKIIEQNNAIDLKYISSCFTADVIVSCAFGLDCNNFKDNQFQLMGNNVFKHENIKRILKNFIAFTSPKLAHFLNLKLCPQDVTDFFVDVVTKTVQHREENNVSRKDFLQLLIEMKNNKLADNESLTLNEIIAQSLTFFLAAHESSSTIMTFAVYELCKNQNIQQKLQNEIENVLSRYVYLLLVIYNK